MAYWITHIDRNNIGLKQFHCDYSSDIQKLPTKLKLGQKQVNDTVSNKMCAAGSRCFCHETGSTYVLGQEIDEWVLIKSSGSSGGGGSVGGGTSDENIEPISNSQIESLFL